MRITSQSSSGGVFEQIFSLGKIPGVLWTPEGAAGTRPLIVSLPRARRPCRVIARQ